MPRHRMYRKPLSREMGPVGKQSPPKTSGGSERLQDSLTVPSALNRLHEGVRLGESYRLNEDYVATVHYHVHAATKCQRHSAKLAFKSVAKQGPLRVYPADRFSEVHAGITCYRVIAPGAVHLALEAYLRHYDLLDRCTYAEASELRASGGREDMEPRPIPKGPNHLAADERERRNDREKRPTVLQTVHYGQKGKSSPMSDAPCPVNEYNSHRVPVLPVNGTIPPFLPLDNSGTVRTPANPTINTLPPFLTRAIPSAQMGNYRGPAYWDGIDGYQWAGSGI